MAIKIHHYHALLVTGMRLASASTIDVTPSPEVADITAILRLFSNNFEYTVSISLLRVM